MPETSRRGDLQEGEEENDDSCQHVLDVVVTRNNSDAMDAERRKLDSYQLESKVQQKQSAATSVKMMPHDHGNNNVIIATTPMGDDDDDDVSTDDALVSKQRQQSTASSTAESSNLGSPDPIIVDTGGGGAGSGAAPVVVPVRRRPPQQVQPGAVAEDGPGIHQDSEDDDNNNDGSVSSNISEFSSGLLAVADLVSSPHDLPQAKEFNPSSDAPFDDGGRENNNNKGDQFKTRVSIWVAVVSLAAIALVVGIFVSRNKNSDSIVLTGPPSLAPSMSLDGFILSVLYSDDGDGDDNVGALLNDLNYDSPQYRAYQWLLEDSPENLRFYSDAEIRQKFALVTLYYATGGNTWSHNTNWLNHSVNECDWFGKPDFAMKAPFSQGYPGYLAGFLEPPPIARCNDDGMYQHLWLDQNNLVGSLPPELYWLTNLQTLSIGLNKLTGTISSHIGRMTALEGLAIFSSSITSTIPTQIGILSNLNVLALFKNFLHGYIPEELWKLSSLTDVVMGDNEQLRGTLPSQIGNFSQLRFILFNNCYLTGSIPSELGQIQSLEWLVLYSNYLSGHIPHQLGALSELLLLSLRSNLLEGTIPSVLGHLLSLFLLYLHDNQLTGHIPSELGLLPNLELPLNLANNHLSGTMPSQLGRLTSIQGLELSNNHISGRIPSELAHLTSVGRLNFANNSLSGSVPQELSVLQQSLYMLSLEGNALLSGTIPGRLCDFNGTCIPSASFSELCPEPLGLSFECTVSICGCDCPCEGSNGR